jgi:two-component system chemotaxis sensor kinase CheA
MKLDAALATFEEEARELLEDMERQLLAMESGDADPEAINALFRAAHTIKGSGGLFGFDLLVAFTHHVESLIDMIRDGRCEISSSLSGLLLRCADQMALLVAEALGRQTRTSDDSRREAALVHELEGARAAAQAPGAAPAAASTGSSTPAASSAPSAASGLQSMPAAWFVQVRFGAEVFRTGLDPLSFIRYVGTLGEITAMATTLVDVPGFAALDPETCHLHCEFRIRGELDAAQIASAFEFVRDDCVLQIAACDPEYASARLRAAPGSAEPRTEEADETSAGIAGGAPGLGAAPVRRDARPAESRFLRVEADKLDLLINLVGELVIGGASCNLLAARMRNAEMIEASSAVSALVESIREAALNLRMVPIGATFSRFQRVVRDISQELGKDIELRISGAETELDKSVVEKITDPLTHLVRNALDHGIESRDARQAAGKPAAGVLQLHAYHQSGSIVIEVADDGGGLKLERIRAKAVERGLIQENAVLGEREIQALIFEPGFSTADVVTNVSGRGVGMDVVKRNIESLRGSIEVESQRGVGTTMRIRLPLTLAIIDGFLVGVGGACYVLPLNAVLECVELRPEHLEQSQGRHYINLRGEVLPFVRLRELFEKQAGPTRRENIVVVRHGSRSAGLVVDELLGDFQTVIKPLGRLFGALRGISGSTILGTGEVALILDVPSLIQFAAEIELRESSAPLSLRRLTP